MRDEWKGNMAQDSRSSQGLARGGSQVGSYVGGDRIAGLTLGARASKKLKSNSSMLDLSNRAISARRQVGDAESVINRPDSGEKPWWKNVGMEEGM
ncbi:uncharacterized protein MYCFIDRAFT_209615 [Pseudocercospora fijiensis CIRAD86]|uniref:Uncharacterized protein n=1 Tax=Pseudocercospora fijiensis (strain CIRAD86) TaxID=383855 RepID=N1Q7X1_PSEFD|nr:uncharacterized protein MYCFIDRAFT_209615 [Pseudocercospora fijiensis CIRAD86]EME87806.1 hypothetical protein MYCFIDRAFT_209615 [Pseudocercospora fijiensis CIRAD86]